MTIELLAVAIIALTCGIIVHLATSQGGHRDEALRKKLSTPSDCPFLAISVSQAFDSHEAIIWETQIPILQSVDAAGIGGVSAWCLYRFYCRSAQLYPELYEGSNFRSWLDFLQREQLIHICGTRVFITREGHEFLACRVVPEAEHRARIAA